MIEYFATGEGLHIWIGIFRADDEAAAKVIFRKAFPEDFSDKMYWDFISKGLQIKPGVNAVKHVSYLCSPDFLEGLVKSEECGPRLFFRYNVNCF
jgi:hypothetical protein